MFITCFDYYTDIIIKYNDDVSFYGLTEMVNFVILLYATLERWSSWFKAPVLKTGVGVTLPWVRIPVSPPLEKYPSWPKGTVC